MHLHQLKYFVAIVETGSMTKAALQCHTSQPSISQQISKLEDSLDVKLFGRSGHKVELTEQGAILYAQAKKIFETIDDTKRKIASQSAKAELTLKIGAIPTISSFVLPNILQSLNDAYPNVNLHIREDISENICEACTRGDIDIALTVAPIAYRELKSERLTFDRLYLAVSVNHRLAQAESITLKEIEKESFILMEDIHCLSKQIEHLCLSNHFSPRIKFQVSQIATIQKLIELDFGISILPGISTSVSGHDNISYIPVLDSEANRELIIVTKRGSALNQPAQEFIRLVKECI